MSELIDRRSILCHHCRQPSGYTLDQGMSAFACKRCYFFQYVAGKEPEQPLLQRAAGVLHGACSKWHVTVERQGRTIELSIDESSSVPVGVRLFARTAPFPDIEFTREESFERVGRGLGVFREVEIGDPTFDPHVWVCAGVSAESAQRMLHDPTAKQAIKNILASWHRREVMVPSVAVVTDAYGINILVGLSIIDNASDLRALVDEVFTLAATLRPDMSEAHRRQPMTPPVKLALTASIVIMIAVFAITTFFVLR